MPFYAVGLTKDWVEIRQADTPPKVERSELKRKIKLPAGVFNEVTGDMGGEVDLALKVVNFEGGKVLATIPRPQFLHFMRVAGGGEPPPTGSIKEFDRRWGHNLDDPHFLREHNIARYFWEEQLGRTKNMG